MKVLDVSSSIKPIPELDILKKNSIQGLYPVKDCYSSFWSLLSKIELAVFQEHKEKGDEKS